MAVIIPVLCLFSASHGHFRGQHCHSQPKAGPGVLKTAGSRTELGQVNKSLPKLVSVLPSRDVLYHAWGTTAPALS